MDAEYLEIKLQTLSCEYLEYVDAKLKRIDKLSELKNELKALDCNLNIEREILSTNFYKTIDNPKLSRLIMKVFNDLLKKSQEENYYFFGCTLNVAVNHYNKSMKRIDTVRGDDEIDALNYELETLKENFESLKKYDLQKHILNTHKDYYSYDYELSPYLVLPPFTWDNEYPKKVKFLKKAIKTLEKEKYKKLISTTAKKEKVNKGIIISTSTKEKLILLEELGLIEHINQQDNNNFNASKIARILARITGENTEHLRRCINSLIREDIGDKNHPYYVQSNIDSVHAFLEKEGIRSRNKKEQQQ